jgi:HD-GYP domain-containing protein (c-di-GMP phosphodiesterase class II)
MLTYPLHMPIHKLLIALGETLDLVSPLLINHHQQVSYIAFAIGREMAVDVQTLRDLAIAGALHDIGGLSLADRLDTLQFEMVRPDRHAVSGALLLTLFEPFSRIATMVRHHHVYWNYGAGTEHLGEEVPTPAHILHLADRIAVSIDQKKEILAQVKEIVAKIGENSGRMFVPEQVEAFRQLADRESFWFDAISPGICRKMNEKLVFGTMELDERNLLDLSSLFCRVIDFRSRFTATHSNGVAAVAEALAAKTEIGERLGTTMKIAGLLHDIGKLVVPRELLEKSTPLSRDDFYIICRHPYFSRQILSTIEDFAEISLWTAYHHERLDGSGYPFHRKGAEIPLGARILAVVDTFTALTEERPYRTGMSMRGSLQILQTMADHNRLDPDLVSLLSNNPDEFNEIRASAQRAAFESHRQFISELAGLELA